MFDKDGYKEKVKIKKKKKLIRTKKTKLKDRLRPKPSLVPFTGDFINNFCKSNGIPILSHDGWHFRKQEIEHKKERF
jgi:hypothetical protein